MNIETRSFNIRTGNPSSANDVNDLIITGTAVMFNQKTFIGGNYCFDEIILPGALDHTDLSDVKFLISHQRTMIPVARYRKDNPSTMSFSIDRTGLHITARLDPDNRTSVELYSAIKRGDISGMSFAFTVDDDDWPDIGADVPLRRIKSIARIDDVSACAYPAYNGTTLSI